MKLIALISSFLVSSIASSAPITAETKQKIFAKPLITGASVSADYGTVSPGKALALRYTKEEQIRTIATGGSPGRDTVSRIQDADVKDRSSIIGVDLFFWDSTLTDPKPSLAALERVVALAKKNNLPLVLGEIPELLPGRQPLRNKLNDAIATACGSYPNCRLMPFDRLHKELKKNGYLTINGSKMSLKEIVPDGLHLSKPASEFLADTLLNQFSS